MNRLLILSFFTCACTACTVHDVSSFDAPDIPLTETFTVEDVPEAGEADLCWWREFNIPELNALVEEVLANNLELRAAWWRLAEYREKEKGKEAKLWPSLNGVFEAGSRHNGVGMLLKGTDFVSAQNFKLGAALSYEVDLWRKIDAAAESASFETAATREEAEATALVLAAKTVRLWFDLQEQLALLEWTKAQVDKNAELLALMQKRFSLGKSSSLDVLQQKQKNSQVAADKILIEERIRSISDDLQLLLGEAPTKRFVCEKKQNLPPLPSKPFLGRPIDLLCTRPNLKAKKLLLTAADYEVAAAIGDCFPKLTLQALFDFQSDHFSEVFQKQIANFIAGLLVPIFDGGKLRAFAAQKKAELCVKWMNFGQEYLKAVCEVEAALNKERAHEEWMVALLEQRELAVMTLEEARARYIQGQSDYINASLALSALQYTEKRLIHEQLQQYRNRALLYASIGGGFLE